jgi:hypothetical protein
MSLTPIADNNALEGAYVQRLGNVPSDADVPVADGSGDRSVGHGENVNVGYVNEHVQALIRSLQAMDPTASPSNPDTPREALAGEHVARQ